MLTALSPLDGRYSENPAIIQLKSICSEQALFKYRVKVEIEWLIHLSNIPEVFPHPYTDETKEYLRSIWQKFGEAKEGEEVKDIEKKTNHDVKAVEYFIKDKLSKYTANDSLKNSLEYVHFGCTSEDVNNLAYALMIIDTRTVIREYVKSLIQRLVYLATTHADCPMLARTHGQPAIPTTFGKEMANFCSRLHSIVVNEIDTIPIFGKLNGAVGCYNAFVCAYPSVDWPSSTGSFIEKLGLVPQTYTTQIEPHDYIARFCGALLHLNSVVISLDMDMWTYISRDLVCLEYVAGEVGSSTMPQKVNPIDFENSEGNLKLAEGLLGAIGNKLPISRLQRDLSDSTILRNIGVVAGYSCLGYSSCLKGLNKIKPNIKYMEEELDTHWEVLAEPIQIILRKNQAILPYEFIKLITRGHNKTIQKKLISLTLKCLVKNEGKITPREDVPKILRLIEDKLNTSHDNFVIDDEIAQYCNHIVNNMSNTDTLFLQNLVPKFYIGMATTLALKATMFILQ